MHPYSNLSPEAFWRTAVADLNPLAIKDLWQPKFNIQPRHSVVTAGSCFAQHIGRAMLERGFNWVDSEPAPEGVSPEIGKQFGYGVFSFRTGNIYTTALLLQWLQWAFGKTTPPDEVWTDKEGRFIDPFRPNIEPRGFATKEEMLASRQGTLDAIRDTVKTAKFFVFTLGLTEGWRNVDDYVYPMCPGTIHGTFDAARHKFVNYRFRQVRDCLVEAMDLLKTVNPGIRFILTVSPVPLTATASGKHVLAATTQSKSVLRAVAGDIADFRKDTDYFPSYEIITGIPFRSMFFEPNMRSVCKEGVAFVMDSFFAALQAKGGAAAPRAAGRKGPARARARKTDDDVICEEELLDAFS